MPVTFKKAKSGLSYGFAHDYIFSFTTHIAIHHSGGIGNQQLASSAYLTAEMVSKAHYDRWRFPSLLKQADGTPWYGGYNFFLERSGRVVQFRPIGSETAAQYGWNMNGVAISICLAGNYMKNVESGSVVDGAPTDPQRAAAWRIYNDLVELGLKIDPANILPHWYFQTTQCYGSGLAIDYGRKMLTEARADTGIPAVIGAPTKETLSLQLLILQLRLKVLDLMKQVQARRRLGSYGYEINDCGSAPVRG